MRMTKLYLSGAMRHTDPAFQTWREMFVSKIADTGLPFLVEDPATQFSYNPDNLPPTDKACLNLFTWLIQKSDVVVVNLDNSDMSCGTCVEVHHGAMYKKPIIGFGSNPDTWYSWAAEECDIILNTIEEAVEYISLHYCI